MSEIQCSVPNCPCTTIDGLYFCGTCQSGVCEKHAVFVDDEQYCQTCSTRDSDEDLIKKYMILKKRLKARGWNALKIKRWSALQKANRYKKGRCDRCNEDKDERFGIESRELEEDVMAVCKTCFMEVFL
jgi:hypothetical protein